MLLLTLLDQSEDNVVLFLALHGHEVHAVFPTDVPCIQPIKSRVPVLGVVAAEEVVVSAIEELFWSCNINYNNLSAFLFIFNVCVQCAVLFIFIDYIL
jgi:hypothetical protein